MSESEELETFFDVSSMFDKPPKPSDRVIVLKQFWDDRFFVDPKTTPSIVFNDPDLQREFIDWLTVNTPGTAIKFHFINRRSANGFGNRGGWRRKLSCVSLRFPSAGAAMLFRIHYLHFG